LFLSCRCLILSRQTLTHQVWDKLWWLPEDLHRLAAAVVGAFLGHHHMSSSGDNFGVSISWVRLPQTQFPLL
jgi:hypothetical protein